MTYIISISNQGVLIKCKIFNVFEWHEYTLSCQSFLIVFKLKLILSGNHADDIISLTKAMNDYQNL